MRIRSIENNRRGATMYTIIITSSRDKQAKAGIKSRQANKNWNQDYEKRDNERNQKN